MLQLIGLLIGVIIILLVVGVATKGAESLVGSRTRIIRTVGTVNDGDETPTAAGMIISMPLFDYSNTWNDGVSERSCDECLDKNLCPHCPNVGSSEMLRPQHGTAKGEMLLQKEGFDWRGIHPVNAEFVPDPLMSKSITKWGTEYPIAGPYSGEILQDGRIYNQSSHLTHGVSNQPSIDYSSGIPYYMNQDSVDSVMQFEDSDPDFWDSRECRGAGHSTGKFSRRANGNKYVQSVAYLGTRNDDLFDGERALVLGTQRGTDYLPSTAVKMFHQSKNEEALTLLKPWISQAENAELLSTEPRTLLGSQGYVYKEHGMA